MGLTNDLISQFVKTTKDETKKSNESTHFGTIVEYDGGYYAKLDGTEQLTPILTTAKVVPGERVTVLLKDHSATVTGNISSPSASDKEVVALDGKVSQFGTILADKVDTKTLVAEQARIDALYADNATITGKLTAQEASIKSLEAENVDISGRLNVTEVNVGTLTADNAIIKGKLEVNELSLQTLNADVADINTLIFGSASGTSIQTSFANAVIAQLGNAQIKSAMIESVSAGKITAGDIITNNVRVMSEDGSLIISDETIQISDDTRVRVQIGKDAANDYSINIWDANGNLMFSEGGITDKAIKEAIIRNDMVAANANISGSKLDIQSVYSAMNADGSSTLKGSKIYLDDKGQTLDVAFTSMTNNVSNLTSTVSSQGTQLSAVQGQISSKIWKEDITTAVNGIEVGGRNIVRNSSLSKSLDYWYGDGAISNGYWSCTKELTSARTFFYQSSSDHNHNLLNLEYGQTYTLSVECMKLNGYTIPSGTSIFIRVYKADNSFVDYANIEPAKSDYNVTTNKWTKLYLTFTNTFTDAIANANLFIAMGIPAGGLAVRNIKLEKGNKATDWTPAPEDMEADITSLNTQYSILDQTLNNISATVGQHTTLIANKADNSTVTTVNARVTDLVANLDGFKTTVSNTYTTKTEFNNLEIGGRNLFAKANDSGWGSAAASFNAIDGYRFYLNGTGSSGLYLASSLFTIGNTYTLSYKFKKRGGTLLGIGGHCDGFTLVKYLVDGKSTGVAYHSLYSLPDDTTEHDVTVTLKYKGNSSNNNLYIQVNRMQTSTAVSFDLWDIMLEEGNTRTKWNPAPEDVDAKFDSYATKTEVQQTANSITSTVSEVKNTADAAYSNMYKHVYTADLTDGIYDENTYYPVVAQYAMPAKYCRNDISVHLDSGSNPTWSTHPNGFACQLSSRMIPNGWGTQDAKRTGWIDAFSYNWCDKMPAYISQNTSNGVAVFYLRGGGRYYIYTDYVSGSWTIYTSDYTYGSNTHSPTTSPSNYQYLIDNYKTVERVTNAESSITQLSDRITAEVTERSNLGTKVSTLEQTASGLTVTLNETKNELNNLSVGGRNYYRKNCSVTNWAASEGNNVFTRPHADCPNGFYMQGGKGGDGIIRLNYIINSNGYWTVSFWVRGSQNANVSFTMDINDYAPMYVTTTNDNSWKHIEYTVNVKNYTESTYNFIDFSAIGWAYFYIKDFKVEKGNKATDWTPAPEDVETDISAAQTTATNANTAAANAQSTANSANSLASTANSTANSALARTTVKDTRNDNQNPQWYMTHYPKQTVVEFKLCSVLGISGQDSYCSLETIVPWGDSSGGYPKQVAKCSTKTFNRIGTSATTWSAWVDEAATATNYLNFSSSGLVVGDMTASTLGRNILIGSAYIDFRNNSTVLARYSSDAIYLGMNSRSSVINLSGGVAQLYNEDDSLFNVDYNRLVVHSDHAISLDTMCMFSASAYHDNASTAGYAGIYAHASSPWDGNMEIAGEISLSTFTQTSSSYKGTDIYMYDGEISLTANGPDNQAYLNIYGNSSVIEMTAYGGIHMNSSLYSMSHDICLGNARNIAASTTTGEWRNVFSMSSNNNLILGYGNWNVGSGNTHIYGNKIYHYVKTANTNYKPYWEAGDSFQVDPLRTAGYISSSAQTVYFTIPISKPIIGNPTVTVTSIDGLQIRQDNKYLYGSSASAYVSATYAAAIMGGSSGCLAIRVHATMANTTNATNNSPCGIQASLKITLS